MGGHFPCPAPLLCHLESLSFLPSQLLRAPSSRSHVLLSVSLARRPPSREDASSIPFLLCPHSQSTHSAQQTLGRLEGDSRASHAWPSPPRQTCPFPPTPSMPVPLLRSPRESGHAPVPGSDKPQKLTSFLTGHQPADIPETTRQEALLPEGIEVLWAFAMQSPE